MASRQGSGSARCTAISVVLLAIVQCAIAATYTVGGSAGWNLNVDYATWANSITFKVGDTLLFKYSAELHSVFQVTQANYHTCTIAAPLKSYQSGSDSITLTDATTYYFICGTPTHCSTGMAVTIALTGGASPAPTVSPAPKISPAPKVSPLPSPPKAVPSPAPVHAPASNSHSPSPSPIAPSPSKTSPSPSPSPSPSEAIPSPSPSPSENSPSPSFATSPSSPTPAFSPSAPGSLTPSSPTSPQTPPSTPSNARSTLHSGTVVLLSAVLLGGYSLLF